MGEQPFAPAAPTPSAAPFVNGLSPPLNSEGFHPSAQDCSESDEELP